MTRDSSDRAALARFLKDVFAEMHRAADRAVREFAPGGRVPTRAGGTGTSQGAEPPLGTPAATGYVLSGTAAGARRWVPLVAGAGISIDIDPTTGAITISATVNIQTLTFAGDDMTWGGYGLTFGEA